MRDEFEVPADDPRLLDTNEGTKAYFVAHLGKVYAQLVVLTAKVEALEQQLTRRGEASPPVVASQQESQPESQPEFTPPEPNYDNTERDDMFEQDTGASAVSSPPSATSMPSPPPKRARRATGKRILSQLN